MLNFGNIISSIQGIVDWIVETTETIEGVFSDVDFTVLYSWLPADISAVITAVIAVLLVLAVFGLLKRFLFFLG